MQPLTTPTPVSVPGRPVPLSVPELGGKEWTYVKECLDTNWISSAGPFVNRFETELATRIGVGHAVATTTGTAALHLALKVAGVRADDEVLVPSLTFIATANAARYLGAWPVFLDIEPEHWQLDPVRVQQFLEGECRRKNGELRDAATGRRVSALVVVHALGHPCDMDAFRELAGKHGLALVEDAAEGLGSTYKGRSVGSLSDVACLSFNGNKIISCGGGGAVVTNDRAWAERARHLSTQAKLDPIEYIHDEVGYNYRLTNLQAAVGYAQLERLDEFVDRKRRNASEYATRLGPLPGIRTMREASGVRSNFWLYTILIDPTQGGTDRQRLHAALKQRGIETRPLWQPLHQSPAHAGARQGPISVANSVQAQGLSLPSSSNLKPEDLENVCDAIAKLTRAEKRTTKKASAHQA